MTKSEIEAHYEARFGVPDSTEELSSGGFKAKLYKWRQSAPTGGVTLYATHGALDQRDPLGRGSELLVGLTPSCDDIAEPLANLAATIVRRQQDVAHGMTWNMGGPLWVGTELDFFVTVHQHKTIDPLVTATGDRIEFFQAIPIFASEAELAKSDGFSALKGWWMDKKVYFWNPRRQRSS